MATLYLQADRSSRKVPDVPQALLVIRYPALHECKPQAEAGESPGDLTARVVVGRRGPVSLVISCLAAVGGSAMHANHGEFAVRLL